ncbi:MAG: leucine-rich repeat protein [Bacteroidales bacterium]|nr:leucine-rich repeat protein [Bacteroidales bacterium]
MKRNSTIFKRATRVVLVALLLGAAGLTKGFAYDFEATAPTGQTLYFQIVASTTDKLVRVTYPNAEATTMSAVWDGYTKPIGDITIPTSVVYDSETYTVAYIGQGAFYGCNELTGALVIPNTIRTIGTSAFNGCSGFTSLTINPSNYYMSIGNRAFQGCSGFTGNLTLPYTVQTIGDYAFYNCTGFDGTLTLSSNLVSIGNYAFTGYSNNAYTGLNFTGTLTLPNKLTSIGNYAFRNCKKFTRLIIGSNVETIGNYAFMSCTGFTGDLVIPDAVTTIGQDAFDNCVGLDGKLTIGSSVQTIGAGAFWNCNKLTGTLTIPASVTEIGGNAFALCKGFTELMSLASTVPTAAATSFVNTNNTSYTNMDTGIPVHVPTGTKNDYQQATGWNVFTNILEPKTIGTGTDVALNWSEASNWSGNTLPTGDDFVYVNGKVNLDVNATVSYLHFVDDNKTLAIQSGKTLTASKEILVNNASQLTIKDGGQLKQPINGLQVTVEKDITGYTPDYTETNLGYYFVCSPLNAVISPENVENMLNGNYDLYRFSPAASDGLEWINYKPNPFNMSAGYGFLYANEADQTLKFVGNVYSSLNRTLYLNYVYNENENDFNGWRLVGNTFVCDGHFKLMNSGNTEALPTDFYKMKEDGSGLEMCDGDYATLKPCEGAFFYCNQSGRIYFYSEKPTETAPAPKLNISLSQNRANIDQVRVRFGNYNQLPKFNLFENNSKLYIPQDGTDFAVVSCQGQEELPVNFKAEKNGTYTLSFNTEDVEFSSLRLIDNLTGVETDLLATPSYTFTAKTTDYASRFRLVFEGNNVNENVENANFAYFNGSEWVVNASENATLQVIDMTGRVVATTNATTIATDGLTAGMYMLRLVDGNNVKTQKIVVR